MWLNLHFVSASGWGVRGKQSGSVNWEAGRHCWSVKAPSWDCCLVSSCVLPLLCASLLDKLQSCGLVAMGIDGCCWQREKESSWSWPKKSSGSRFLWFCLWLSYLLLLDLIGGSLSWSPEVLTRKTSRWKGTGVQQLASEALLKSHSSCFYTVHECAAHRWEVPRR